MRKLLAAASLTALVAVAGCNRKVSSENVDRGGTDSVDVANAGSVDNDTRDFVTKVAQSTMVEIETGKLAATRAGRAEVRDLAAMLVRDHTAAAEKLRSAAEPSFTVPAALDADSQAKINDIADEDGEFDSDYLDLQEESHEASVANFERYAKDGGHEALKTFASATLPTLRQHLARIREIREGFDVGDDMMGIGSGAAQPVTPVEVDSTGADVTPKTPNSGAVEPTPMNTPNATTKATATVRENRPTETTDKIVPPNDMPSTDPLQTPTSPEPAKNDTTPPGP